MASKSLGTLTLDIVAKTGGFVRGMDAAERKSSKWRRQVERDVKKVGTALGRGLAIGATAAAAGLAIVIQRSRETIDAQAKAAQQLRTTSESLANLKRAGDLAGVSMKQIEVGARTLDVNVGKAAQGIGLQARAFEKLKLNADEISALPLDKRILAINKALRENVSETERAAVAADLFGTRNASAIQQLQPDVIEQAAKEVAVFGLNLSEVDAAKVELANDALSTAALAAEGLGQQLTVAVAPAIRAVGVAFFDYAEEAGGASQLVTNTVDATVTALSFVADAADGISRAFEIAADVIILTLSTALYGATESAADLLALISKLPGIDYSDTESSLRQFSRVQKGIFFEATASIKDNLERPLAGNALREGFEQAKIEAERAAEAAVAARSAAIQTPAGIAGSAVDVVTSGPSANDQLVEITTDHLKRKSTITDEARETEEEKAREHAQTMIDIDQARYDVAFSSAEQSFGGLAQMSRQFAGEQSDIFKVLFAAEKSASIARSIVAIQTGIAEASANPWPANLAAMASVISATSGIVSTIASTTIQGQAHDGLMSVPKTGTYLLEQGERVTTANTSAKLDKTLDGVSKGSSNIRIVNSFDSSQVVGDYMGSSDGEKVVMNIVRRNARTIRSLSA